MFGGLSRPRVNSDSAKQSDMDFPTAHALSMSTTATTSTSMPPMLHSAPRSTSGIPRLGARGALPISMMSRDVRAGHSLNLNSRGYVSSPGPGLANVGTGSPASLFLASQQSNSLAPHQLHFLATGASSQGSASQRAVMGLFHGLDPYAECTIRSTPETQVPLSQDDFPPSPVASNAARDPPDLWGRLLPQDVPRSWVSLSGEATWDLCGENPHVLGRGSTSKFRLRHPGVSSRHCTVYLHEGLPCIEDHGSSNGTFVNDVKLQPHVKRFLAHGDIVSLVTPCTKAGVPAKRPRMAGPAVLGSATASTSAAAMTGPNGTHINPMSLGAHPHSAANEALEDPLRFEFVAVPGPSASALEKAKSAPALAASYALVSELGRGNFATVFKAYSRTTGEMVAVKIIEKSRFPNLATDKWFAQVMKEADTLRKLDHPGIVGFRDLITTESALYVVTELLSGGELFDRLVKGPYPEPQAKVLVRRIVEAVAYLHEQGIVHRDLKPENIVMRTPGDELDVKVVDFGVATEENDGRKTFCGSMSYVAPEVLERRDTIFRRGSYGKSVDMWSLGVIVYIVLSGCPPFDDRDESGLHNHLDDVLRFPGDEWDHVSAEAKDFIRKCLVKNESTRLSSKAALTHPWLAIA